MIANGSDYYFSFKTIDVIRNGQLIKKYCCPVKLLQRK